MSQDIKYRYSDLAIKGNKLLRNADCALQALRTLLFTQAGERLFRPEVGSELETYLWRTMDEFQALQIKNHLVSQIMTLGDLVTLDSITVEPDYNINSYRVYVKLKVDGIIAEDTMLLKNKAV